MSSPSHFPATPGRDHGLDAVRAVALLLGVVLHAAMSFLPGAQVWIVADVDRSTTMAITFYVIHMFRMVLFFLIAGYFAHMLYHRVGCKTFIKDRLKRVAMPLFAGWPIIFPLIVAVVVWSAWIAGGGSLPETPPPGPTFMPGDFPLAHLWFLWVLLLLYGCAIVLQAATDRFDKKGRMRSGADRTVRFLVTMHFPVLLATPLAIALYAINKWYMAFGIPTPDNSLYANVPAWVAFGSAFGLGWLVHRQSDLLDIWKQRWGWNLCLAIIATIAGLALLSLAPMSKPAEQDGIKLTYAMIYSIGVWAWTFAIIGTGLRFMSGFSARRRYVADASYWLYLIHLPMVMALQVSVAKWPLSWAVKFPLILLVSFGVMLASYQWFVRYTAIGAALNGKRHARPQMAATKALAVAVQ